MANLTTINLPDLVANKDILFLKEMDSLKNLVRNSGLFQVDQWGFATGDTREYSEIDLEEYATQKDESDDAEQAKVQQGFTKTVSPFRFGKDISISWELRNRGKYQNINRRITNLARLTANRMDLDLSHRITFGTATSYETKEGKTRDISIGDGLALFSTAHLLKGSSLTYRNRLANNPQLSKGALESMEQLKVENTLNQFGEKMDGDFDILYVTDDPNTMNTARQLMMSTAEISAPNAGVINVQKSKYRIVMLPRVPTTNQGTVDSSKAKFWGIAASASSNLNSAFLSVEEEPNIANPSAGSNAEEFSTEDWIFKGRASYAMVIVGARWIGFSSGDATP